MRTTVRHYDHAADYEKVGRFLVRTYRTGGGHINWLQPRWEYMHYHPLIRGVDRSAIGVWEADGEVVGVVHPEHSMSTAYFEIDPECGALKGEMLRYAQEHLSTSSDGPRRLRVYINDEDGDFHDGNIFLESGRYVFFDWGDCSVAHPFFSLRTVSVSLEYSLGVEEDSPEFERLLAAYLEPWQRYAPQAELLEVFRLASHLSPLCSALSWGHALSGLEPAERQDFQQAVPGLLMEYLSFTD